MRHYFHIRCATHEFNDNEGEVLDTVEAAKARAKIMASELVREPLSYPGYSVIVINDRGETVTAVPIAGRLPW